MELGTSCKKASNLIKGDRNEQYGSQWTNFAKIAAMASLKTGQLLTPLDIINIMTSVKDMRESYKHNIDNRIDNIGYQDIGNYLEENCKEATMNYISAMNQLFDCLQHKGDDD